MSDDTIKRRAADLLASEADKMREQLQHEGLDEKHRRALQEELRRLQALQEQLQQTVATELRRLLEREQTRQRICVKLATLGRCPAGFSWTRHDNGFTCGGGSHHVALDQLGVRKEEMDDAFGE